MRSIGLWGIFQLVCLTLFMAINGGRTVSLLVRHKLNPIKLRVQKRGAQGLADYGAYRARTARYLPDLCAFYAWRFRRRMRKANTG